MKKSVVEEIELVNKSNNTFIIVSVGRLLYIKNFKLTIIAFSLFLKNNPEINNAKLQITGDGGDRKSLVSLCQNLGISEQVEFIGQVSMDEVQTYLANANVFLFPTLENAGFVIIEAMSHSLPVLAMNYGGPQQFLKHYIDQQLVSAEQAYNTIAENLADNLVSLYRDRKLCNGIGQQNRQDVLDNFTWEAKAQKMKTIYQKVLNDI